MEKNKDDWKLFYENLEKQYPPEIDFLIVSLFTISDKDYQLRVWYRAEGPEEDWYDEAMLSFDAEIDYFKDLVRWGRTKLNKKQVKEILRVHVMGHHFTQEKYWINCPEGWKQEQLHVITHPYWEKIREQAKYALSLIKL